MIDTTNRNTALASALVEELARCGARHAIVSPGSRSSPVALALDRDPELEVTIVLDERSAGFVALGVAIASGAPAILACTSGSAAANYHPAVVEADQAGVPLIVLTSDRPPELRGIGAGQTIDQVGLYGSATRWFCEVGTHEADDAGMLHHRSVACRAFGEAVTARGPVHLNLSWRDPLGPEPRPEDVSATGMARDGRSAKRPLTVPINASEPSGELVDALADALARSSRPLLVAGHHPDPDLPGELLALGRAGELPILAGPTAGLRGPGAREDGVITTYDAIFRALPASLTPDLIVRFGDMPTSKPLRSWLAAWDGDQIVVDPPGGWNEPSRRAGALIRANPRAVARSLAQSSGRAEPGWRERWVAAEQAAGDAVDAALGDMEGLSEPAFHRALGDVLDDGDQVLLASSMPIRDAESFGSPGVAGVRFHASRGANGIDGTISTGCGIALASGAPTWIVLGDLALAHDLGGLAAVEAVEAPLRIVVLDNGGGAIFDFLPQAGQVDPERFERLFTTPSRLDLERVAALFGLPYAEVEALDGLASLSAQRRVLARVPVERAGNVELHRRIAEAQIAAVAAVAERGA